MEAAEYANIYQHEETHFYYRALHGLLLSLLKKYSRSDARILDGGCGTGYLAKQMESFGSVEAIDNNPLACSYSERRGIKVTNASLCSIPFADESFDTVVSVDVLYHTAIESDAGAIAEMRRVLKPGGRLILKVPAIPWLRSLHDRHVHTRERYGRKQLRDLLLGAGFEIEKLSFTGLILLPFAVVRHFKEKNVGGEQSASDIDSVPAYLNTLFFRLLSVENFFILNIGLPLGLGLIAVGRKKV